MSEPNVYSVFDYVKARARKTFPSLGEVKLCLCKEADEEHRKSSRQYAHYNHHRRTICVSRAIESLTGPWKVGLMAHEFGHAFADEHGLHKHTEGDADHYGGLILGAKIHRKGPQNLEWAEVPEELR